MTLILRDIATKARAIDPARRYAEFVASTETLDAHGTIVRQNWDLSRYGSNPVVLRDHHTGRVVGKGDFRVEGKESVIGILFAKGTVDADETWALVEQDMLRAVSVGFRPKTYSLLETDDESVLVYEESTLFEVSVVAIPSNPDALARSYRESDDAELLIRQEVLARRESALSQKEPTMADAPKPATTPEAAAVAPAVSAPETVNKEAMDIVVKTLRDQITERDADIVKLKADNAKMLADLADAKKVSVEAKVRGFVGSKLTEATLPKFLDLAKKSEEAFDAAIEALPDLGIAPGKQIVPEAKVSARAPGDEDAKIEWTNKRAAERVKDLGEDKRTAMRAAMHEAEKRGLGA